MALAAGALPALCAYLPGRARIPEKAPLAAACHLRARWNAARIPCAVKSLFPRQRDAALADGPHGDGVPGSVFCSRRPGIPAQLSPGDATDPPVVGKAALPLDPPAKARVRKAKFVTAADLAKFVKAAMPMDAPGSLSDDDTYAIVAHNLKLNNIKLDKKVDATSAAVINLR